jgi:hypothetical protein
VVYWEGRSWGEYFCRRIDACLDSVQRPLDGKAHKAQKAHKAKKGVMDSSNEAIDQQTMIVCSSRRYRPLPLPCRSRQVLALQQGESKYPSVTFGFSK